MYVTTVIPLNHRIARDFWQICSISHRVFALRSQTLLINLYINGFDVPTGYLSMRTNSKVQYQIFVLHASAFRKNLPFHKYQHRFSTVFKAFSANGKQVFVFLPVKRNVMKYLFSNLLRFLGKV